MSNDPASGGEQQPAWHGQQPYPGGYGQHAAAAGAAGVRVLPAAAHARPAATARRSPPGSRPPASSGTRATRRGRAGCPPQNESPSFFGALFDFGFNSFATPVVIKVLYILGLVGIGLGYVAVVISGVRRLTADGARSALIGGAVVALFYVIFFRVFLEFYYAVVRMSEDIRAMRNRS